MNYDYEYDCCCCYNTILPLSIPNFSKTYLLLILSPTMKYQLHCLEKN